MPKGVTVALAGAALLLLAACQTTTASETRSRSPTIVRVAGGQIEGIQQADYREFLGVPYAAAPVGPSRWLSPQPVAPWDGVRAATQPGRDCPQTGEIPGTEAADNEDCLFVGVTTPDGGRANKPVMVWLHGGGFMAGNGSVFDPHRLATTGDVVVVSVNYRLGIFGYFGYPGLEGSGAFGFEDQQAALRWVRANITQFGGDPNNVTLFGESAGGMSTCAQLTTPASAGLFHRAIVQSGSCFINYPKSTLIPGVEVLSLWAPQQQVIALGQAMSGQLGCAQTGRDAALACLRALPASALLSVNRYFAQPAYGGAALPEDPIAVIREGRAHRMPVMSGGTRDEHRLMSVARNAAHPFTPETYRAAIEETFAGHSDDVLELYPVEAYEAPVLAWASAVTARAWACPTLVGNELLSARGVVYAYEFSDRNAPPGGLERNANFSIGAAHFLEVPYLLDIRGDSRAFSAEQQALANTMVKYWSNFARTGNPNGPDTPAWRPFDASRPYVQDLAPGAVDGFDYESRHHCGFWRQHM